MAKTLNYKGKEIEVVEVDVLTANEPWNEYQLSDGRVLFIKTILVKVLHALHEKSPDGDHLYITNTSNVIKVS